MALNIDRTERLSLTVRRGLPGSNGTAVEQGVLRVAALYDISTMDVSQTTDDYMVPMNVFDRLFESGVQSDGSTAIVSSLCESYGF